jgi:hypothetical protein
MDTIAVLVEEAEGLLELANLLLAELIRHGNGGDERKPQGCASCAVMADCVWVSGDRVRMCRVRDAAGEDL